MKVIPPLAIVDAMLTSNAPEPGAGETAWVSGTTYALGDVRILASTHRKYERLIAGAGAITPDLDATNWLDVGPTNAWAMFAFDRNTQTVLASPLTISIAPGRRVDSIAVMGLDADSITIEMLVGATVVYSHTEALAIRRTLSWFDYFFLPFSYRPSVVKFDLPPYASATINVTLTSARGAVKCAALVIGSSVYLGQAEYNATSGALNFSRIDRDAFGNSALVPRRTVPTTNQTLWIEKLSVNSLRDTRTALNAMPAVFSGMDDKNQDGYFEALLILGIYKEWTISLDYPDNARVTLQLEEI